MCTMGWITLACRRNELQNNISEDTYEKLMIQSQLRKLSNFSSAIADGMVDPSEIASLGGELFGDALDFNAGAHDIVSENAQLQTDLYEKMYGDVTQEQYYNNPALTAKATLYYDESGNLNTEAMYNEFYEENLKQFAEEYYMPMLKEKEEELQQKITQLEVQVESEEAELQTVKEKISQEISNNTIRL